MDMIAAPETPSQNDIDVRNKYIIELTQRAEQAEARVKVLEAALSQFIGDEEIASDRVLFARKALKETK